MTGQNMPPAEIEVTPELVRRLLVEQRPDLAAATLTPLAHGWDNELYRVGDSLVGRFPRRAMSARLVENEARWLPTFVDKLPLPIPSPKYLGGPGMGYPWRWALTPWLPGRPAATTPDLDLTECARQLGAFLSALHLPAPPNAPHNPYRGVGLSERDESVRRRIESLEGLIDTDRCFSVWETALDAPTHDGPALWLHGDLHPLNLLVVEGRLSGVVDFGDVTAGDPATDLAVAWNMLEEPQREILFATYGSADHACLTRARGWALVFALAYLANSADNPVMHSIGEWAYREVMRSG